MLVRRVDIRQRPGRRALRAAVSAVAVASCALVALPSTARATPDVKRVVRPTKPRARDGNVLEASSCPALFGFARRRAARRTRREQLLHFVSGRGKAFVIAHGSSKWASPRAIDYRGLRVAALDVAHQRARVVVSPKLAHTASCAAGTYQIALDDTIGHSAVLAVLVDGLLLERDRSLRYLAANDKPPPAFWMVWGSPYRVVVASSGGGGRSTTRHTRRKKRRVVRRGRRRHISARRAHIRRRRH